MRRRTFLAALSTLLFVTQSAQAQGPSQRKPRPIAILETTKGTIKLVLYPEVTPKTVTNFIKLVKQGFYNGLPFVSPAPKLIQTGDPKGDGTGGPGYTIPNEKNGLLRHNRGAVAMANSRRDTAGSQFYIVLGKPAPDRDLQDPDGVNKYTLFGQVVEGQAIAEKLQAGDKIKKATIKD